jgi:molybdopterin molybdotransferase
VVVVLLDDEDVFGPQAKAGDETTAAAATKINNLIKILSLSAALAAAFRDPGTLTWNVEPVSRLFWRNRRTFAKTLPMISEKDALAKILDQVKLLPGRAVSLSGALDCFSAKDLVAREPLPSFDNSAMDGYAVVANSCPAGARLRVTGEQPAGQDRQLRVAAGEAIRIFTGAPMPRGADAVIMQEDVTRDGDEIVANVKAESGEFIRRRGCDLSEGQKILARGARIRTTTLALLASQGFENAEVGGEVRASIISTGDELVSAGQSLRSGEIYDSNSVLLRSLVEKSGARLGSVRHCRDDSSEIQAALRAASRDNVVIITGGVSVGAHDLVQSSLREVGGKIDIWRVAIKPGKPFLFGQVNECAVFGLPGNAVSAFVTFLRLVRPAILKMMGAAETELALPKVPARLVVDLKNSGDRAHYFRGRLEDGKFQPIGRQESHALFGLSQSNALLRVGPGEQIARAALVEVEVWE